MFPVSLLNLPSTVTDVAGGLVELAAVRQHEFDSRIREFEPFRMFQIALTLGLVFEVAGLGTLK